MESIITEINDLNSDLPLTGRGEMFKSEETLSILPKIDVLAEIGIELLQSQKEIIVFQREEIKDLEGKILKDARVSGDV